MNLPPDPPAHASTPDGARPPPIPAAPNNAAAASSIAPKTSATGNCRPRAMGMAHNGEDQGSGNSKGSEARQVPGMTVVVGEELYLSSCDRTSEYYICSIHYQHVLRSTRTKYSYKMCVACGSSRLVNTIHRSII